MRFKLTNKRYLNQLEKCLEVERLKIVDSDGKLSFSGELVYLVAKASGLRSNRVRHLVKRFRLIMRESILNMIQEYGEKK